MTAKIEGTRGKLKRLTALNKEWPIATGSVEGACRHVIGDRRDITGDRWGLADAEAVFKLRAASPVTR